MRADSAKAVLRGWLAGKGRAREDDFFRQLGCGSEERGESHGFQTPAAPHLALFVLLLLDF